jgi:ABC-type nitrate/sulfonate/bicarbonate transport system ATPase subunit
VGADPKIVVEDLVKTFPAGKGRERLVLDRVSFRLAEGTFVSAVGPSGCGKSTLLNIIAGLLAPTSGTVRIAGPGRGATATRVGYVFQQPRLLNWLTVKDNVEFALQAAQIPRAEWGSRVAGALKLVGLESHRHVFPLRLSGGQQQRASIARALATDPDVVLMDEPFSHLDEISAGRLREELTDIWDRTRKTVLFITHSIAEAVLLSESIMIFGPKGRIVEEFSVDIPRPRARHEELLFQAERRVRSATSKWWAEA